MELEAWLCHLQLSSPRCVTSTLYLSFPIRYFVGNCENKLPWWLTVKNLPVMWETRAQSLGWEDPLEEEMATHSSILAWKSHGQRSLESYSPLGRKELDKTEQLTLYLKTPNTCTVPDTP